MVQLAAVALLTGALLQGSQVDAGAGAASGDEPPSPAAVIELIAARPGERVRFEERRYNRMLSEAMILEGYVSRSPDGTLVRVVQRPFTETATIDGARATLERDGHLRTVSLDRRGAGAIYLRTLYALLTGDEAALRESFDVAVTGSQADWEMTLSPRRESAGRWLSRILVDGSGDRVGRIRMEREDGAWQEMRLLRPVP